MIGPSARLRLVQVEDSLEQRGRVAAHVASWLERVARGERPVSRQVAHLYIQAAPLQLVRTGSVSAEFADPTLDDQPALVEIQACLPPRRSWVARRRRSVTNRRGRQALRALGFHPPDRDVPNWWQLAEAAQRITVARGLVEALVDVIGIPLAAVAADLGMDPGQPWADPPPLQYSALVDELDADAVVDLLATARHPTHGTEWYRRTRSGWVADPTIPDRLSSDNGERLRLLDEPTARQVEASLLFR